MPIALTPGETWDYQLSRDRVSVEEAEASGGTLRAGSIHPQRTVFRLGRLTARQHARAEDARAAAGIDGEGNVSRLFHMRETVDCDTIVYGLRGWERFADRDGREIPWPSGGGRPPKMAESGLEYLDPADTQELAEAIRTGNRVTVIEGN